MLPHHVGEEGDHKHAVGEAALEIGSRGTQQGVKSSDHHNRQIRLHDDRNVRLDEHADDDADD